jgi:PAS domain S-box-containing protein
MESLKLVIIEDEETHFELMKLAIERGFPLASVHHFKDAGSCLERLDEIDPDVIITDYMMPGMNGIEFLKALKQEKKETPVIVITGQGDENIAVQAMKLGAWDYLVKSTDFFTLLPSVIGKVDRERKLQESLQRSERRFKEIFVQSPIGIELYDSNGLLVEVNQSCLDILGVSDPDHIKGLKLFDDSNMPPEAKAKLLRGETVRYEAPFDFEQVKKRNLYETTRSGSVYLDVVIAPVRESTDPAPSGYMMQVRDTTERKRSEEYIRALSQELMRVQETERQRLSRDLHDNLAQDLSTLKISLDTLFDDKPDTPAEKRQRVHELSRTVQRTIAYVRDLAYDLRPAGLDHLGLVEAVHRYCRDFSKKNALKVDFFSAGLANMRLDFDTEIALYRVIQEGLNNIWKHADAGHATVRLSASFPHIILRIEDNGKGFCLERDSEAALREKQMGLQMMRERVALLKGRMRIESRPKQGTIIVVKVPYKEKKIG